MEQLNELTNYPAIIAQLNLSPIVTALIVLSADIVEASSELDGIIVIGGLLGGFRWIHNERYLDMNSLMDEIDVRCLI